MARGKKAIASFELVIVLLSLFAFSYLLSEVSKEIIPLASASSNPGCCEVTNDRVQCAVTNSQDCSGLFVEGSTCSAIGFCQKGCCYNEEIGNYYPGSLQSDCDGNGFQWAPNPTCNMPGAYNGCCVFDGTTGYMTEAKCRMESESRGMETTDWRSSTSEAACIFLAVADDMGACVMDSGSCTITRRESCSGEFSKDMLCTAPGVNSFCEKTTSTTCVSGKEQVYFVDSCGNKANIYDSSKINNEDYWTYMYSPQESCNSDDRSQSVDSTTCGNCDRLSSVCSLASKDGISPGYGDNYCKSTMCTADTNQDGSLETVLSGESWCVYQGKIGNGDDTVGSEHIIKKCQYGEIITNVCGKERNQICSEANLYGADGSTVVSRSAQCISNIALQCMNFNEDKENGMEDCEKSPQCIVQNLSLSEHYDFAVCVPKFPQGFDLTGNRGAINAAIACSAATLEFYVPMQRELNPFTSAKCKTPANKEIMTQEFVEKMNEFCRKLGDCGGGVNYVGTYSQSFEVSGEHQGRNMAVELGASHKEGSHFKNPTDNYRGNLSLLSNDVSGQSVNASEFAYLLEGMWGAQNNFSFSNLDGVSFLAGTGGIAYKVASTVMLFTKFDLMAALGSIYSGGTTAATATLGANLLAFTALAAGTLAGVLAAAWVADKLGLEGDAAVLAIVAGGALGLGVTLAIVAGTNFWNVVGWVLAALALIVFIGTLFVGECEDYVVKFECNAWEQPVGGDNCDLCNQEEVCTKYKCNSLGAACRIENAGTEFEICAAIEDDSIPPIISENESLSSDNIAYSSATSAGFKITNPSGGCLDSYQNIQIGISTSKLARCKYSNEYFENMNEAPNRFGLYYLKTDHILNYPIADPSHGESLGLNYNAENTLYVKCEDPHGHESPSLYTIEFCVNQGVDITAPIINTIIPKDNSLVGFNSTEKEISVFTNEWSDCRWSPSNIEYSLMENEMQKVNVFTNPTANGYGSITTIPTPNSENTIYINCKDQPWLDGTSEESSRNSMSQNRIYNLKKPSKMIEIDWIKPDGDFRTPTRVTTLDLEIKTSGGGNSHYCSWSLSGYETMWQIFGSGNTLNHKVPLNLVDGKQRIYVECFDETGDTVRGMTEFEIKYDGSAPLISRAWQENNQLHIATNEIATCEYSTQNCNFNLGDGTRIGYGTTMSTPVQKGETYYIKCKDEFENTPSGSSCSIQIVAT